MRHAPPVSCCCLRLRRDGQKRSSSGVKRGCCRRKQTVWTASLSVRDSKTGSTDSGDHGSPSSSDVRAPAPCDCDAVPGSRSYRGVAGAAWGRAVRPSPCSAWGGPVAWWSPSSTGEGARIQARCAKPWPLTKGKAGEPALGVPFQYCGVSGRQVRPAREQTGPRRAWGSFPHR